MPTRLKVFAIAAVLAAGASSAAMAQHAGSAGDMYYNGVCQPVYWKPVSGTPAGSPLHRRPSVVRLLLSVRLVRARSRKISSMGARVSTHPPFPSCQDGQPTTFQHRRVRDAVSTG
jgi:hypothetical protein